MTTGSGAGTAESLPERFFEAARRVLVKDTDTLVFNTADILRIAQDSAMQADFREIFRTQVNNVQLADIIVHCLEERAADLESRAKVSDIMVDWIDRSGLSVAAAATVAAVGVVVASGAALGPLLFLGGGFLGLTVTGGGRTLLKLRGHRSMIASEKVRRLMRGLELRQ